MKKTLKQIVQAKIVALNQEDANLTLLAQKISEQMSKVQLGRVKTQAALLVLNQTLEELGKENVR